ncbi:MAG TPA: hypothetical protein VJK54_02865, partial [Chthoniobacterales bacterium]|nr:hypothetical protein [Chthoniobacterales bacterium]
MQSSIEATIKAIEACTSGDSSLAERYSVEAKKSEQATELMKQAAQAYKMGKNLEGFSWYLIGKCTEQSSAIMLKAIEARIAGSIPLAESYTEEAQKLEEALELIQQAVKAFEAGKVYEGDNLELIGLSIHESVETMIKAIEARIEGNASLAENYTIEIKKLERAIGLMKQAVEALKAGKASEGHKWRFIGESVRESATMMINAIEAKKVGDVFLAEIFTIEAKKSERAVELAEQANQANAVEKKLEARDLMLASVCMRLSAQRMMLAIDARNEEDEELFKKYRAEAKELEQCSHIFEDNELTQEISNSEYEEKQSGADQPCVENNELPLKSQGDDKTFTTQTDLEIIEGIEGEYLFPRIGGGFYRGQWYKQHALERMAPKTPEMKALLFDRAIKRAQRAGLNIDTDLLENRYDDPLALKAYLNKNASLKAWWSQNGPQLRAIPPSLVEQEIAHPGTTKLDVRMSEEGDIITTFFNRRKIKRVSRSPLNI